MKATGEYVTYENTGGGRLSFPGDPPLSFPPAQVRAGSGRREKIPGTGHRAEAGAAKGILQGKTFKILY